MPHTSLFLLADTATGQRWLGEQPQAEASCPPHLPGRADPARDENQGSEQRGESQGPANAAAGEGPAGQGLPGALVMCAPAVRGWEADWAHCSCPVPQFPSEAVCVCATASLCIVLGALTAWDDLGREGKRARVALLSVSYKRKQHSRRCARSWALSSHPCPAAAVPLLLALRSLAAGIRGM